MGTSINQKYLIINENQLDEKQLLLLNKLKQLYCKPLISVDEVINVDIKKLKLLKGVGSKFLTEFNNFINLFINDPYKYSFNLENFFKKSINYSVFDLRDKKCLDEIVSMNLVQLPITVRKIFDLDSYNKPVSMTLSLKMRKLRFKILQNPISFIKTNNSNSDFRSNTKRVNVRMPLELHDRLMYEGNGNYSKIIFIALEEYFKSLDLNKVKKSG